ncbi:hypothetical protein [Celerinatantimonas yamalensis]|uniref:SURF1-like protein n=1 Tax=Celerinatantimonas yamalensis TaxID=559956 RepID=A0ABW9G8W8_9GAMM
MIIKGQVREVGQNNLTICPKAQHQWVRCAYIEFSDGHLIEGPLLMKTEVYAALLTGQPMIVTLGHWHARRSVTRVQLANGTIVGKPPLEIKQWFSLTLFSVLALYSVLRWLLLNQGS